MVHERIRAGQPFRWSIDGNSPALSHGLARSRKMLYSQTVCSSLPEAFQAKFEPGSPEKED